MSTRPPATVRFLRFHRENPRVFHLFVRFSRDAKTALGTPIGINLVTERVRWETSVVTTGDAHKLNNNFAPFYARLIMHSQPDLRGAFTTRRSVADEDGRPVHEDQAALWAEAERDNGWLEDAARAVEDSR